MNTFKSFRPSEKLAVLITAGIFLLSAFAVYKTAQYTYGSETPKNGGSLTEGVIGYARFINPLLASTDADKDLTTLIYSGLLKVNDKGELAPDLAESWSISPDGLTYTVNIKPSATFHDGEPVTADDIEFTIQKAINPAVKSTQASNWTGIAVTKVNPYQLTFTLKKPYSPFAENLTLGILPKHIWESVSDEAFDVSTYNKEPIGSGPYKIKKTKQDRSGLYEYYELTPFSGYTLGAPFIEKFSLKFYKNEDDLISAFKDNDIDLIGGLSPEYASSSLSNAKMINSATLPRTFALFFNQNVDPVLINKEVRKALDISVDRNQLISLVLKNYGVPSNSPLPTYLHNLAIQAFASSSASAAIAGSATSTTEKMLGQNQDTTTNIDTARKLLESNGWKLNTNIEGLGLPTDAIGVYEKVNAKNEKLTFSFTITTANSPELKQVAEALRTQWAKIGANVKIEIYENSDLTQKIIRPRKYSALLFGQETDRDMDLYPFWHSSQRVDPGLNIALYANIKADEALENTRATNDIQKQFSARVQFEKEIQNDIPAIFLFSPEYIYASNIQIKNMNIDTITESRERLSNINSWYLKTKFIWKKSNN